MIISGHCQVVVLDSSWWQFLLDRVKIGNQLLLSWDYILAIFSLVTGCRRRADTRFNGLVNLQASQRWQILYISSQVEPAPTLLRTFTFLSEALWWPHFSVLTKRQRPWFSLKMRCLPWLEAIQFFYHGISLGKATLSRLLPTFSAILITDPFSVGGW